MSRTISPGVVFVFAGCVCVMVVLLIQTLSWFQTQEQQGRRPYYHAPFTYDCNAWLDAASSPGSNDVYTVSEASTMNNPHTLTFTGPAYCRLFRVLVDPWQQQKPLNVTSQAVVTLAMPLLHSSMYLRSVRNWLSTGRDVFVYGAKVLRKSEIPTGLHPTFFKPRAILETLRHGYASVLYMDLDSYFFPEGCVFRDELEQLYPDASLIVQDYDWINTGVMVWRNTAWSRLILQEIWDEGISHPSNFAKHPWEQIAFQRVIIRRTIAQDACAICDPIDPDNSNCDDCFKDVVPNVAVLAPHVRFYPHLQVLNRRIQRWAHVKHTGGGASYDRELVFPNPCAD